MPPPKLLDQLRKHVRAIREGLRTGSLAQAHAGKRLPAYEVAAAVAAVCSPSR